MRSYAVSLARPSGCPAASAATVSSATPHLRNAAENASCASMRPHASAIFARIADFILGSAEAMRSGIALIWAGKSEPNVARRSSKIARWDFVLSEYAAAIVRVFHGQRLGLDDQQL